MFECKKHKIPFHLKELEFGKNILVCVECEREQLQAEKKLWDELEAEHRNLKTSADAG